MEKAKRKILKFDFNTEGSHVALVDAAANGQEVLLMKSMPKAVNGEVDVTVAMSMKDFLSKFFYMWEEDAEELASLLGYGKKDEKEAKELESAVTLLKSLSTKDKVTVGEYEMLARLEKSLKDYKPKKKEDGDDGMTEAEVKALIQKAQDEAVAAHNAKMVELQKAHEAELLKAKESLAELQKAAENREKDDIVTLVKSWGMVDEDKRETLIETLFKMRKVEGATIIIEALEAADKKLSAVVQKEIGHGEEDITISASETEMKGVGDAVSKIIKSKKKSR